MARFNSFEEIEAWQSGRELTRRVYEASRSDAFGHDFGLRDQIRRACVSITSNIAEGFERGSRAEFVRFLVIAKGSAGEVRSQLYCALDQRYLTTAEYDTLNALCTSTSKQLAALIRYLRATAGRPPSNLPTSSP